MATAFGRLKRRSRSRRREASAGRQANQTILPSKAAARLSAACGCAARYQRHDLRLLWRRAACDRRKRERDAGLDSGATARGPQKSTVSISSQRQPSRAASIGSTRNGRPARQAAVRLHQVRRIDDRQPEVEIARLRDLDLPELRAVWRIMARRRPRPCAEKSYPVDCLTPPGRRSWRAQARHTQVSAGARRGRAIRDVRAASVRRADQARSNIS